MKLVIVIAFAFFFGDMLGTEVKSIVYAVSLSLKELLLLALPFVIFSCLFSCVLSFHNQAIWFLAAIFGAVFISNYLGIMVGYGVGVFAIEYTSLGATLSKAVQSSVSLDPMWSFSLPKLIKNEYALISGIVMSLIFTIKRVDSVDRFASKLSHFVTLFLQKLFIPVLPIFALGFVLKMQHDGMLGIIIKSYGPFMGLVVATYILYTVLIFGFAAKFNLSQWVLALRRSLPAGILGFSTMSSMAALPVNVTSAEQNTGDPAMARVLIPATVNVHMIGDRVGVPMMILAVMATFGHPLASIESFITFGIFYAFYSFAIAGVPGGGILVVLPLLESDMGFTPEMLALVYAIYVLFDPFITATNVMSNGGFAMLFAKVYGKFLPHNPEIEEV